MKKARYTAHVQEQKKTKDWAYIVTDKRTGDEIVMGGILPAATHGADSTTHRNTYSKKEQSKKSNKL